MKSIAPNTHIIQAYVRNGLAWKTRIGEFIDNSFDAGATYVSFVFGKDKLVIQDDGNGCPKPETMVQLGGRHRQPGEILGRYGIGIKEAAISTADAISIQTICDGTLRSINCDWKQILNSGIWEIEDPESEPSDDHGTIITLSGMISGMPDDKVRIIDELSLMYSPAIKKGKQIRITWGRNFKTITVPDFTFPNLRSERTETVSITSGGKVRKARVRMGIIPDGESNRFSGLVIAHSYRVITREAKRGLSDQAVPSLFGWIDLLDGWHLGKNKDHISEHQPALMAEIRLTFADLIKEAESQGRSVRFIGIGEKLTDAVNEFHKCKKAKRQKRKGSKKATAATGKGTPHQQAVRTQSGNRFPCSDSPEAKVKIVFTSLGEEGPASRWNEDYSLEINIDIPFCKHIESNTAALVLYAAQSVAFHLAKEKSGLLQPEQSDVAQMCGDILRYVKDDAARTESEAA